MERQRRTASKVTDYRKFHLSGDLDEVMQGRVSSAIELFEKTKSPNMSQEPIGEDATNEQLQELLREQQENSTRKQQQMEAM